jgi:hypothetical protein
LIPISIPDSLRAFPREFFRRKCASVPTGMFKSVSTKKMKKMKRFVSARNVDSERSGEGTSGIPHICPGVDNMDIHF